MPLLLLKISRGVAFVLLLLSLLLPWFRVPVSVLESHDHAFKAVFSEPVSTSVFKILVLLALVIACWIGYRRKLSGSTDWTAPMTVCGCILLPLLGIAYPALTMQRCGALSAHAAWLEAQNDSLIQPVGDLYLAPEFAHQPGQLLTNVSEVMPTAFEALPPVVNSFSDLRLSKLGSILKWLGLSPAFCEFVYRGWFCGIFGSFLLAVSFVRMGHKEGPSGGKLGLFASVPLILVGAAFLLGTVSLIPVVMAGRELQKARTAALEGRLGDSLHHLGLMEVWVPVLAFNTEVVFQHGWLDRKMRFSSGAAQLYSAIREEQEHFDSRAAEHYTDVLDGRPDGPIRDEAYRGALRMAVKDLNAGLIGRAADRLGQLQAIDPSCVKANYALQLAYLRTFRKEELQREVARFEAVYGCFQCLEKSGLIASAHRRTAELDFDFRDTTKLGDEMRAAIKP
jgi:hypothetical protein